MEDKQQLALENQVVELQNQLINQTVNQTEEKMKLDEMVERADWYENLYNKKQAELYEAELEIVHLKEEVAKANERIEQLEKCNIETMGIKKIVRTAWKKCGKKIVRG